MPAVAAVGVVVLLIAVPLTASAPPASPSDAPDGGLHAPDRFAGPGGDGPPDSAQHGNRTLQIPAAACSETTATTGYRFGIDYPGTQSPVWANLTLTWDANHGFEDRLAVEHRPTDVTVRGSSPLDARFDLRQVEPDGGTVELWIWCDGHPGVFADTTVRVEWTLLFDEDVVPDLPARMTGTDRLQATTVCSRTVDYPLSTLYDLDYGRIERPVWVELNLSWDADHPTEERLGVELSATGDTVVGSNPLQARFDLQDVDVGERSIEFRVGCPDGVHLVDEPVQVDWTLLFDVDRIPSQPPVETGTATASFDAGACGRIPGDPPNTGFSSRADVALAYERVGEPDWVEVTLTWDAENAYEDRLRVSPDAARESATGTSPLHARFDLTEASFERDTVDLDVSCVDNPALFVDEEVRIDWTVGFDETS